MSEKNIVMYSSDDAAVYESRTLTGWWTKKSKVTHGARFWGDDEHMARFDGSTHNLCECGEVMSNVYTRCGKCRSKTEKARYENLIEVKWDGETPLCIYNDNVFFYNEDDVFDYCEEHEVSPESLMLVICEPVFLSKISAYDHWHDDLAEDGEIPDAILSAVEVLNNLLATHPPSCWQPGSMRTSVRLAA